MRIITGLLAAVFLAGAPFSAPAASYSGGPAPADEYFGPHHQSILEIRNRLDRFDRESRREMLEPGVTTELDDVANSVRDWRDRYPNDPWLPRTYARLLRDYHRAGEASTPRAVAALDEMKASFPDAPETSATVAMIYGNAPDTPLRAVAAAMPSEPSGAWARFDAMRGGSGETGP
jgi:hypothetical protein